MLRLKPQQIHQQSRRKKKSPEPRPFTTVPHTDSLPQEEHCEYEQCTWKTGPLWSPPPWRQPSSRPSSPQMSPERHFNSSDSFPSSIRSLHEAVPASRSILKDFFYLVSVVGHHNHCYFSLSFCPSYKHSTRDVQASPHADTSTAEMIVPHGNDCGRKRQICFPRHFLWMLKNTSFLKSAFLFIARQRHFCWETVWCFVGCVGECLLCSGVVQVVLLGKKRKDTRMGEIGHIHTTLFLYNTKL